MLVAFDTCAASDETSVEGMYCPHIEAVEVDGRHFVWTAFSIRNRKTSCVGLGKVMLLVIEAEIPCKEKDEVIGFSKSDDMCSNALPLPRAQACTCTRNNGLVPRNAS